MKSYIACRGSSCRGGCLGDLLVWATEKSKDFPKPISIFKARAGEKDALLIMEVFEQSVHPIQSGQYRPAKELRTRVLGKS